MLIIDVEYLMGRLIASSYSDKSRVEYPPHPSRLFSALVAAYEENDLGEEARRSLEWLETLQDPAIYIDDVFSKENGRDSVSYFVPVNDPVSARDKKALRSYRKQPSISPGIGLNRLRAERKFPAITPADKHVKFLWDAGYECDTYIGGLKLIAENVTYLGHSATPVIVRVMKGDMKPTLIPKNNGQFSLRTLGKGRLSHLEQVHNLRTKNPGIQPRVGRIVRYGYAVPEHRKENFGGNSGYTFTFRISGSQMIPGTAFYKIISVARSSMLSLYPDPIPDVISGHHNDGTPLNSAHLSVVPHLNMGHPYASGHLLGFSFILPKSANNEIRSLFGVTAFKLTSLNLGRLGTVSVQQIAPDQFPSVPHGLNLGYYEGPSESWATVTPIVLGRHPKLSSLGPGRDGGPVFRDACQRAGVMGPDEVITIPTSIFEGISPAREYAVPQKFGHYLRTHAIIRFPEKISGPIIIGSGSFSGFGLLYPFSGGY
ncbi:MAG: type I-U CRISPR-associated protein Csb2 [Candidatus Thermoplasmatota archaeon]|nr:type I-U CRISPR-associated protein Csb2 [Candidatus Thermoplasmatota archaeon]